MVYVGLIIKSVNLNFNYYNSETIIRKKGINSNVGLERERKRTENLMINSIVRDKKKIVFIEKVNSKRG